MYVLLLQTQRCQGFFNNTLDTLTTTTTKYFHTSDSKIQNLNDSLSVIFFEVIPSSVDLLYSSSGVKADGILNVTVGSPVSVTCNVVGSKPAANIFWNFDGIQLPPDGTQENTTNELDLRLTDSASSVTLTGISLDHQGAVLICCAEIPPNSIETTTNVTLNVKGISCRYRKLSFK